MTLSTKTVVERGFVDETPKTKEVTGEHANYCTVNLEKKQFPGDVLGYVTPVSIEPSCNGILITLEKGTVL